MFVAIVKRVKDLDKKTRKKNKLMRNLPDDYPIECHEFKTEEEAKAACPEALVLPADEYGKVAEKCIREFDQAQAVASRRPFWKFWS